MSGTVKKLQFSEGTDVGAPTDLGIASSTIVIQPYANDAAYVTANGAAISGSVYLNTTLDLFRYYTNGFFRNALAAQDQSDPTKEVRFDYTAQGTGRRTTIALSSASTDKTITLQNVTDTLIGRVTPDQGASRVFNKDFDDATFFIVDTTDTTKKIGFNAGGTTGTSTTLTFAQTANRIITAPDATGTIVLNDNTATLSNKTIASGLLSGGSLDISAAGNFSFLASAGANTISIGGSTSTVRVVGNLQVDGTTVTVNSATLDVVDPNITVNKGGNNASSEGAGITVDRTGTKGSFIYANALTSRFKIGDLGSEVEVMTTTGTQLAQNKTITLSSWSGGTITLADFDGSTASNTSRVTIPKASTATLTALTRKQATIVYDTTLNKPYYDDGSALQPFGSGSGSGGINYISANSDFETGTTGYATYADAAGTTPVDGTGGSPNVTINARAAAAFVGTYASSGNNPLRGTQSLEFAKDAANRQGQGFSYAFTIDRSDISKPLKISFEFEAASGYVASDMGIYIYDVTNATLISPSSINIPAGLGKWEYIFSATTSLSYRLIWHVQTTNATAYYLKVENVSVSPTVVTQSFAADDWKSYTPTFSAGFGTVTNIAMWWRREGDTMKIRGSFKAGTAAASNATMSLPTGYAVDGNKLPAAGRHIMGHFANQRTATAQLGSADAMRVVFAASGDTVLSFDASMTVIGNDPWAVDTGTNIFQDNAFLMIIGELSVPISIWNSALQIADRAIEEYASNSSVTDADDTTSFVNGSVGSLMPGSTFTATRRKRIRFQTPIQKTDVLIIEGKSSSANAQWQPINGFGFNDNNGPCEYFFAGSNTYGIGISSGAVTTQTDLDILFGQYKVVGTTYNGAGSNWDGSSGAISWRVRKIASGASIGYPISAANVTAQVDGNTIPQQHIGENLTTLITADTAANSTANTENDISGATLSNLGIGVWFIGFQGMLKINDAGAGSPREVAARVRILTSGGTAVTGGAAEVRINTVTGQDTFPWITGSTIVTIAATTSYKLGLTSNRGQGTGGNVTFKGADNGDFTGNDNDAKIFAWRIG